MGSRLRDGRSVLLVGAGGSDARTDASGMMAGLPCRPFSNQGEDGAWAADCVTFVRLVLSSTFVIPAARCEPATCVKCLFCPITWL